SGAAAHLFPGDVRRRRHHYQIRLLAVFSGRWRHGQVPKVDGSRCCGHGSWRSTAVSSSSSPADGILLLILPADGSILLLKTGIFGRPHGSGANKQQEAKQILLTVSLPKN
ncbi:unnamed protein product, partial [Urochloa humidicola]